MFHVNVMIEAFMMEQTVCRACNNAHVNAKIEAKLTFSNGGPIT